jgi:hypothetical protein
MERNENGYSEYNFSRDSSALNRSSSGRSSADFNGGMNGRSADDARGGCRTDFNGGAQRNNCAGTAGGMNEGYGSMTDGQSARLAMAYVPMQCWRMLYSPDYGLTRGTLFEELDLPLEECVNE